MTLRFKRDIVIVVKGVIGMQTIPRISLKAARVNSGLSQNEAAKRLGISRATLQNYESGNTVPDILMSRKIEEVYGFPADFIFFGMSTA